MKFVIPCPFCGHDKISIGKNILNSWRNVYCRNCGCRTQEFQVKEYAEVAWNTRKPPEEV